MIPFYWYMLCIGTLLCWHAYDVMFMGCDSHFGTQKNYATTTVWLPGICTWCLKEKIPKLNGDAIFYLYGLQQAVRNGKQANKWYIVAAFRGMDVSPAKHSYAWLPRMCDYQTRRRTKWPLCAAMLRRWHKNVRLRQVSKLQPHALQTGALVQPTELSNILHNNGYMTCIE